MTIMRREEIKFFIIILTICNLSFGYASETVRTNSDVNEKIESSLRNRAGLEIDFGYFSGLGVNIGINKNLSLQIKAEAEPFGYDGGILSEIFFNFFPSSRFGILLGSGIWLTKNNKTAGTSERGNFCFRFFPALVSHNKTTKATSNTG